MRISRLNGAKINSQRVGQPAARAQADQFPHAMLANARLDFFHFEIYARPPARQRNRIFQGVGYFFDVTFDAPAIDKMVVVGWHTSEKLDVPFRDRSISQPSDGQPSCPSALSRYKFSNYMGDKLEKIQPSYLALLRSGELRRRVEALEALLERGTVCPRDCLNNRLQNEIAACYSGRLPIVSSYTPHFGEEPPLVGTRGAGNIFFGN